MKKLALVFLAIIFLSCSSDNKESSDSSGNKTNFVEINGSKYYFDNVKITRSIKTGVVDFTVEMQNTPLTNRLGFGIRYSNANSLSGDSDLLPTTYSYRESGSRLLGSSLIKYNADGTSNVVTNEKDFIGVVSRVILTKNSSTNYTFDFNYVTSVGTMTGSYTGEITKTNF
ncbi:hypothetical protein [Flavobacterium sp. 3-210]